MNYCLPEEKGISSQKIIDMLDEFEKMGLVTHDVIIAKGEDIVFEKYWKPFHKDFNHRMYSVTKSVVAIAVGFLLQDGLISLDDPMEKYFSDKMTEKTNPFLKKQTIRNMMTMHTSFNNENWFQARSNDRVKFYFDHDLPGAVPPGTLYSYDSSGTFIIGALVERVSGMKFLDFMREKLFDKIGVSKDIDCLECPGGHSWTDSALLCKATDLLKIARFTLNYGKWNGEQILSEEYLREATSSIVPNDYRNTGINKEQGYGFYIWRTYEDSFSFNGMGNQYAICVPGKDIIMIYNGDNQGTEYGQKVIFDAFFKYIVDPAVSYEIPVIPEDKKLLEEKTSDLKLYAARGETYSPWCAKADGKKYVFDVNPMGLKWGRFEFYEDGGCFFYENEQGEKKIRFGMCENVFAPFEQDGYSDRVGSEKGNRRYDSAASAAWISESILLIKVQIIDTYFGNFTAVFSFLDNYMAVEMRKTAEDFLNEYQGRACGILEA